MPSTASDQAEFDFARGDQLGMLRDAVVPTVEVRRGVRVSGATLKAVLRQIDDCGRGRMAFARAETIAQKIRRSPKTVMRAIAGLQRLDLLAVDRRWNDQARATINHYSIVWTELARLTPGTVRPKGHSGAGPKGHADRPKGHADRPKGHPVPATPYMGKRKGNAEETLSPPPPPASDDDWAAIERSIVQAGVREWERALRKLRSRVPAAHAAELLRVYAHRPGAYGAVALYQRLMRAHPDLPPRDGWPNPIPDSPWVRAQAIRRAVRSEAAARQPSPPESVIARVIIDRLEGAGLDECIEPSERRSAENVRRLERAEFTTTGSL